VASNWVPCYVITGDGGGGCVWSFVLKNFVVVGDFTRILTF
jgi:hypothetical protein